MTEGVSKVFSELDGGNFENMLTHSLNEVAGAVMDYDGKGKVIITLDIKRLKNSAQVNVEHTIKRTRPTKFGKNEEDFTRSTLMYVGPKGEMSYFPPGQKQMFGLKNDQPNQD